MKPSARRERVEFIWHERSWNVLGGRSYVWIQSICTTRNGERSPRAQLFNPMSCSLALMKSTWSMNGDFHSIQHFQLSEPSLWTLSSINIRCRPQCDTGTGCPNNVCLQKPKFLWGQLPPHPMIQWVPTYAVQCSFCHSWTEWQQYMMVPLAHPDVKEGGRGQKRCDVMWGFQHHNQGRFLIGSDSSDVFHTVVNKQTHQIEYLRNANFLEKTDDRIESGWSDTA